MHEPTPRQQQVLRIIATYLKDYGYPPSQPEIAAGLGVKNVFGIQRHLDALAKKGLLSRTGGSSRGIRLNRPAEERLPAGVGEELAVHLPIVGTVRAGMPQPPLEDLPGGPYRAQNLVGRQTETVPLVLEPDRAETQPSGRGREGAKGGVAVARQGPVETSRGRGRGWCRKPRPAMGIDQEDPGARLLA